jgi:hypothetical protein
MYPVLIGSRALHYWKPDRKITPDTDWDVISFGAHPGCEIHNPHFLNNLAMTGYASSNVVELPDGKQARVMTMLGLAIIKRSHLWRDLSFQKHITDFHKFGLAEALESSLNRYEVVEKDLKERTELTMKAFPQRHPNLNVSVEDFFDDAVIKTYPHDLLHELFAYGQKPVYTLMQPDPSKAWCSKEMWDDLRYLQRLQAVCEETMVIATERFLIPKNWNFSCKRAYFKALDKVCTTLCSGFFRDFAIDNYSLVVDYFDEERFRKVQRTLKYIDTIKKGN